LLKFRLFVLDNIHKKLIFKTSRSHSEVNKSYLNADFRKVMRVLQFGSDKELKFGADSNPSVSKFDGVLTRDFLYVFGQKRFEGRIKLFLNVLDHNWVSRGETDLNDLEELRVTEFSDHHLVLLLHVFDPLVTLSLRINKQRPSFGCRANNTVLNGKVISR
jgi:hypothetical protein